MLSTPALLSLLWPLPLLRRPCWACWASVCQPRRWAEAPRIISFAAFSAVFAAFGAAMTPALPASLQLTSLQSSSDPAYAGPPVPDSDFATSFCAFTQRLPLTDRSLCLTLLPRCRSACLSALMDLCSHACMRTFPAIRFLRPLELC